MSTGASEWQLDNSGKVGFQPAVSWGLPALPYIPPGNQGRVEPGAHITWQALVGFLKQLGGHP